jgi:DNA-binding CsgD family transcriptional regulator
MEELLYLLVFFFCLASAVGSILLSQKLNQTYPEKIFESLYYYVILISFFGFYGIWGQVIVQIVLDYLAASAEFFYIIGQLIPLLGFPFLIMGGNMLIRFGKELWGEKMGRESSISFFLFYLLLLIALGWFSFNELREGQVKPENPLFYLILFFLIQEAVIHGWFLIYQLRQIQGHQLLSFTSFTAGFSWVFLVFLILKILSAGLLILEPVMAPLFIIFYFFSCVSPVLYLYRHHRKIVEEARPHRKITDKKESILQRNGITRREKEIINLICMGKTNQEIADSLFISLQTVKDHTHRIYLKLDVKNRMQLIHLLQNT